MIDVKGAVLRIYWLGSDFPGISGAAAETAMPGRISALAVVWG
jgi:hypothetical protein